jgi:hypothetical protein
MFPLCLDHRIPIGEHYFSAHTTNTSPQSKAQRMYSTKLYQNAAMNAHVVKLIRILVLSFENHHICETEATKDYLVLYVTKWIDS